METAVDNRVEQDPAGYVAAVRPTTEDAVAPSVSAYRSAGASGRSSATPCAGTRRSRLTTGPRDNRLVSATNVETARRGFEAALRGDLDAIGEMLDADVKWHGGDPSAPGACHGRREALAFLGQSDVIRGGRFELVDVVGIGDKVVVSMQPPSDGGEPIPPVANLTTFRDGKVVEMVHYPDASDALAAARASAGPPPAP
jgi:ketosteroid isomerase-like protein